MAGDHLATDVALARRQTVRHEQQADQLIAGCWLDRDGDLVVVPADQRACLEDGPLATRVPQPRTETAIYTPRRTTVGEKYRQGQTPATVYPNLKEGKISNVGQ